VTSEPEEGFDRTASPAAPRWTRRSLGPVRELLINVKARELMAIAGGVLKQRREECVGEAPTSPLWSRLDTHGGHVIIRVVGGGKIHVICAV